MDWPTGHHSKAQEAIDLGSHSAKLDVVSENSPKSSTTRWQRVVERWQRADLGESPPAWMEEFETATETTMQDLVPESEPESEQETAWRLLQHAFEKAGADAPPSTLRPLAASIINHILLATDE